LWPSDWGNLIAIFITHGAFVENSLPRACAFSGIVGANTSDIRCQSNKKEKKKDFNTHSFVDKEYLSWWTRNTNLFL
jgi:hypothetical protein